VSKIQEKSRVVIPDEEYTYAEIAAFAKVHERRVRRWVEEGKLGYVQHPKGRRVLGEQYLEFRRQRRVDAVVEV